MRRQAPERIMRMNLAMLTIRTIADRAIGSAPN
jgi:hypothetical protein